jgi:transposase/4-amino-4-deoxy-L-arabinose transferase-like glycosyltransferase
MDLKDQPESMQHSITSNEDPTEKLQIIPHIIDFMEAAGRHDQDITKKRQLIGLPVQQTGLVVPEHEQKSHPTDLTDAQWQRIAPLLPPSVPNGHQHTVEPREVVNGILYVVCGSHDWRSFPHDSPPRGTVYSYFRQWQLDGTLKRILDALCSEESEAAGHEELPGAAPWNAVSGELPASPDPDAALLDDQDNLNILRRLPNFFVLATPNPDDQAMTPRASNGASKKEERNGAVKLEKQTSAVALNVPAHPETLFTSFLGRLRLPHGHPETLLKVDTVGKSTSDGRSWRVFSHEISVKMGLPSDAAPPRLKMTTSNFQRSIKAVKVALVTARVPTWLESIIVMIGLLASFAAHAINMFNYPHYEQDEGTYMMYAWAVTHGRIDPYPYGYGHPPLAWIQLATWVKLTGGFATFGNAINSGRVLVLLLAVASTWLVYQITRSLGGGLSTCLLAMAIFSLSPLSIAFQREVLLDNFATFWLLLALYLLVVGKSHLLYTISAAICFGLSILSKEVLIVLFPVMIYVAWLYTTRFQRPFALVAFIYVVIAVGSTFVLMAILKGELFPYSWHLPWDHHPHLSLIDTYKQQVQRGQSGGSIPESWNTWVKGDPLLIASGIAAPVFNFITGWWNRKRLFLSLLAVTFWALLLRGGVVFAFYIIPLLPLIALNAVLALNTIVHWIGRLVRFKLVGALLILCALAALIPYDIQHSLQPYNLFTLRPALVETEALSWIRAQVPSRAMLVINSNLYTDLHEQEGEGVGDGAPYPHAEVYWFAALDPSVHDTLLKGNWDRIDYIVADSAMLNDIKTYGGGMDMIKTALEHSVLRAEFKGDDYEVIQIYQVIHINPPPEA